MGSTARVSIPAKPCSSNVRCSVSTTCCSTKRCSGSSSGNPLSGVGLAMSQILETQGDQVGVGRALAADGRLLAVSGEHDDVVGEGQDLRGEAAQHRGVVAAGQVGAP